MTALALGALACASWIYLLTARGGFWRAQPRDGAADVAADVAWPAVAVIVPARNEEDVIGRCVASLVAQRYAGKLAVSVVDDDSCDATADAARRAAIAGCGASERFSVVAASPTAPGWTGKLWALECGIVHAKTLRERPEYLLFTDADIVHDPDSVQRLVSRALAERLAVVSLMARLDCATAVERAFVPAFVFFFQMLYPFAWVNRARRRTAAAAGGCMLVHRATLERAGGLAAVRGELIDDCAIARLVKPLAPIRLALTERVRSVRSYRSLADVRRMVVRSAYAQLRFSPLLLAATVLAMSVAFVAAPLLALFAAGPPRALGALAWIAMALAFQPTLRFYRVSALWGVALPAIAGAYLVFTLDSAYQAARGRAGLWKGRVYPRRSATR
jgi:hopene-associated glycosyltransferase HpnB